jgi:hypothetical protein
MLLAVIAVGALLGLSAVAVRLPPPGSAERAAVCKAWAREYREARDLLAQVKKLAWDAQYAGDGRVLAERAEQQARVDELDRVRPDGCTDNGLLR